MKLLLFTWGHVYFGLILIQYITFFPFFTVWCAAKTCSSQGTCKADKTCDCNDNFSEPDCSKFKCTDDFGDDSNDASCNSHGTCNGATGECTCTTDYTGTDCSISGK